MTARIVKVLGALIVTAIVAHSIRTIRELQEEGLL